MYSCFMTYVYANDISKISEEMEYLMLADALVLIFLGRNLYALVGHVKNRLGNIADWCKFNKLCLNSDKCKYMLVTNRDIPLRQTISINYTPLEEISEFKYFGLQLEILF